MHRNPGAAVAAGDGQEGLAAVEAMIEGEGRAALVEVTAGSRQAACVAAPQGHHAGQGARAIRPGAGPAHHLRLADAL
jgi:acetoin utilization deacetylase AcuC-like enzyme